MPCFLQFRRTLKYNVVKLGTGLGHRWQRSLVVDDEPTLRNVLQYNLTKEAHHVRTAGDGEEAIDQAREYEPDLILLDVMLPKLDGFEVCKAIRRESNVPILMLTAKDSEIDKVVGLEIGADDYITKPFSMRELVARVKAMIRRSEMLKGELNAGRAEKDEIGGARPNDGPSPTPSHAGRQDDQHEAERV